MSLSGKTIKIIAEKDDYKKLFGNVNEKARIMPKCACVACNSCTCSCSCRNVPVKGKVQW